MSSETQSAKAQLPWFVAIGASGSDGLTDIGALLAALSPSIDAVVLIVLHRAFDKPSYLAEVLGRATTLPVFIAEDGERFVRGFCYVGEPAAHLTLAARSFSELIEDPGHKHRNRTVDLLFRSIAAHGGSRTIGVILSGSLDDGARGIAAIHAAGGWTMVITPDSPSGAGMPENAIHYDGPIDTIGSARQISTAIHRLVDA